jgi:hypothetical protein
MFMFCFHIQTSLRNTVESWFANVTVIALMPERISGERGRTSLCFNIAKNKIASADWQ